MSHNLNLQKIEDSLARLDGWVVRNGWLGYDPFDGLSAPFLRKLTFELPILRIALQQTVRRLPVNIRPLVSIHKAHSNQAMGYFASGYLRLFSATGNTHFLDQAVFCLSDLIENISQSYRGFAWGWSFDYQSRGHYLKKGVPSIVWTSFIAHAFLDAYEALGESRYLNISRQVGHAILHDFPRRQVDARSLCISYIPTMMLEIHNANMLAASVLARIYKHTRENQLLEVARQAVQYTMDHQHENGSWYYGEGLRWHWVDGYHTGFVLDSLYWYQTSTGELEFESRLQRGMEYYRQALFDGAIAKHYDHQRYPIDIQSVSQAIQTFALIPASLGGDLSWAEQVACWAIQEMQDSSGYFYFRKGRSLLNKTPFLHWGQSTMLAALALLIQRNHREGKSIVFHTVSTEAR